MLGFRLSTRVSDLEFELRVSEANEQRETSWMKASSERRVRGRRAAKPTSEARSREGGCLRGTRIARKGSPGNLRVE